MKIALLTLGTRGDVQPFLVLGRALHARGHQVTVSTASVYGDMVRQYGLHFEPVMTNSVPAHRKYRKKSNRKMAC